MTVGARRGNEGGQAIEQFEGGDDEGDVALGAGLGGVVAVASIVDLTQAILGESGPCAVAQQPLEGIALVGGDEDAGIQTESTARAQASMSPASSGSRNPRELA